MPPQKIFNPATIWSTSIAYTGQIDYDFYRHGNYPPLGTLNGSQSLLDGNNKTHLPSYGGVQYGGKVKYNLLYCDGHASTIVTIPRRLPRPSHEVPWLIAEHIRDLRMSFSPALVRG